MWMFLKIMYVDDYLVQWVANDDKIKTNLLKTLCFLDPVKLLHLAFSWIGSFVGHHRVLVSSELTSASAAVTLEAVLHECLQAGCFCQWRKSADECFIKSVDLKVILLPIFLALFSSVFSTTQWTQQSTDTQLELQRDKISTRSNQPVHGSQRWIYPDPVCRSAVRLQFKSLPSSGFKTKQLIGVHWSEQSWRVFRSSLCLPF